MACIRLGKYFIDKLESRNDEIATKCDPVLLQLMENGDNPNSMRMVDHWIYFHAKADVDNFLKAVSCLGYEEVHVEETPSDNYSFAVNIARNDNVVRSNVYTYVLKLSGLAKKNKGDYGGWGCAIVQ